MSPVPLVACFGALDALLFAQGAYYVKEYTAKRAERAADRDDATHADDA